MVVAYEYIRDFDGIGNSSKYPYKGDDVYSCSYNPLNAVGSGVIDVAILPAGKQNYLIS